MIVYKCDKCKEELNLDDAKHEREIFIKFEDDYISMHFKAHFGIPEKNKKHLCRKCIDNIIINIIKKYEVEK